MPALALDAWADHAACKGADTDLFYPIGPTPNSALALCAACPVWDDCLTTALNRAERGIWGGTTETQRRRIRAGQEPRPTAPPEVPMTVHAINPAPNDDQTAAEPTGIQHVGILLKRGEESENAATRAAAQNTRAAIEDLRQRVATEAAEKQVRDRIAELEQQLAEQQAKLNEIRPQKASRPRGSSLPDGVKPKDVRAWAAERGIACPDHGRIPKYVADAYAKAHGLAGAS